MFSSSLVDYYCCYDDSCCCFCNKKKKKKKNEKNEKLSSYKFAQKTILVRRFLESEGWDGVHVMFCMGVGWLECE